MKFTALQRRSVFAMLFFILGFFIFSSVNFYSPRYILCLYPFWFTIAAFICIEALKGIPKFIPVFVLIGISGFQIWFALNVKTINDCDLGYADCVITQRDAIRWCVKNNYEQKEIFAQHQLERAMESDAAGFVQANEEFKHVGKNFDANTALFIFTCNEHDPSEDEAHKLNLKTIIKFQQGKAWTEICAPKNNK